MDEIAKTYDPKDVEPRIYERWIGSGAFHAEPGRAGPAFSMVIPPPNVTAALHLGHALNNTLQDILARWHRMQGQATLWMPGTDHAGIATQTVVEKRILAEEGKRRTDFERQEFVGRIQTWKDEYEKRILGQLKAMGCSCDWERTRFTMDDMCARAVRAAFFKLFSDGLIYRGKRLVNWDPATQTVLADDEVEHESVKGHFYYLSYPLEKPVVVRVAGVSPAVAAADETIDKRMGRYLPHWSKAGGTYAVTFRLADSVPVEVAEAWREERQEILDRAKAQGRPLSASEEQDLRDLFSDKIESFLGAGHGECLLKEPSLAQIVQDALKHFDQERYELIAWAIMPNQVHVIVRPYDRHALPDILQSWKSFTSHEINRTLRREKPLWMEEYYDHLIRDERDFRCQVSYVLGNPEKAGLRDWPWLGLQLRSPEEQEQTSNRGRDARDTYSSDTVTLTHVTVATTRPETMLGDTAVAMNPRDPRAQALVGQFVILPIVGRRIPIIADEHVVLPNPESDDAKAKFSTGFLKVTPAHDLDDWEIGRRHELPVINVLAPDGAISDKYGWADWDQIKNPDVENLIGLDRFEAREAIVEWFRTEKLLADVRDYEHEIGHSYRSHVPIEPYLSDQWYIAVKKPIEAGTRQEARGTSEEAAGTASVEYIPGTDVPVNSLAGLALQPLLDGRLKFTPDRYANNYRTWLENLRDWPISRQLWWGHQIPIWHKHVHLTESNWTKELLPWGWDDYAKEDWAKDGIIIRIVRTSDRQEVDPKQDALMPIVPATEGEYDIYVCFRDDRKATSLDKHGFVRDVDVLDTWFSSALWPISTMGWPDQTDLLKTFYPTDVLCTAREIITLWVTRMVMFGQYFRGDIPFRDVVIHAMIQDGEGRKMSKSLGNGIDPLDIIASHGADAMRFTLAYMTTQTQDVRMPVEAMTLPDGRKVNSSPKFDLGRNFCNKLWNASRFAMMNLPATPAWSQSRPGADPSDRWILSRLNTTIRDVTAALEAFRFHEAASTLYRFMWNDFCDWYLEIAKTRLNAGDTTPKTVLAHVLDVLLRMLHPIAPFITEEIWSNLNAIARHRGPTDTEAEPLLATAAWPLALPQMVDPLVEAHFENLQALISGIRDARLRHNAPPSQKVRLTLACPASPQLLQSLALVSALANTEAIVIDPAAKPGQADANIVAGGLCALVHDIVDRAAELARLTKQQQTLTKGIAGVEGKLDNAKFVEKAPADLVARERQRLDEMKTELAAVEKALAELQ